jgi:polysaccharide export outer membrane protein
MPQRVCILYYVWPMSWTVAQITKTKSVCFTIFFTLAMCMFAPQAKAIDAYRLGPEDSVTITVVDVPELPDRTEKVDKNGFLDMPLVGRIEAAGKTVIELETLITDRLSHFVRNPRVNVHLAEYHSSPVSVLGEVSTPGVYQLSGPKHLLEMISTAGGLRPGAGSTLQITRETASGPLPVPGVRADVTGKYQSVEIDLQALSSGKDPALNIFMLPNDVVSVPKADLIYVIGDVKKAGGFPLRAKEDMTVLQALSLAEGMQTTASAKKAKILRKAEPGAARTEIAVDVKKILANQAPDLALRADDILFIPNNAARTLGIRTAETAINIGTGIAVFGR